ncbi:hypothetical protein B296_00047560 [Ensete ventricosum]|uniref:Uncharacterized protein n=1 Tax=Ensete ventricosum TaxID=4639 RepID=A0A426YYW8_ENSVE|nr:hypothetical protein B296_00047560 [Ensete ventricosum]
MGESVWWSNYIGRVLAVRLNADGVGAVTPMFVCRWRLAGEFRNGDWMRVQIWALWAAVSGDRRAQSQLNVEAMGFIAYI